MVINKVSLCSQWRHACKCLLLDEFHASFILIQLKFIPIIGFRWLSVISWGAHRFPYIYLFNPHSTWTQHFPIDFYPLILISFDIEFIIRVSSALNSLQSKRKTYFKSYLLESIMSLMGYRYDTIDSNVFSW